MQLFETLDAASVLGFLVEVTIKGTFILATAGLAASLLKSASAASRHLIWSTALILLLVLPVFVAFAPSYDVAVLPAEDGLVATESRSERAIDRSSKAEDRAPRPQTLSDVAVAAVEKPASTVRVDPSSAASLQLPSAAPVPFDWRTSLFFLWLIGAGFVTLRYALGWVALRRIRRQSVPVADVSLRLFVKRTAAGIGLRRRVRVVWGRPGSMPLTFGWIRPTVLLPEDAREWAPDRLVVVLQHELAHVKRWDCLVQAAVFISCTLYWFNPLIWIAATQSHREREMACDDYVLSTGAAGTEYAGHLLEIARSLQGPRMLGVTTIAMARRSELEGRLMAILSPNRKRERTTIRSVLATVAVLGCLVMTIAALRPVAMQAEPDLETAVVAEAIPLETSADERTLADLEVVRTDLAAKVVAHQRLEEQYAAEASALVEKAVETVRSIKLNGSLVAKIDGAINLVAEAGLEIVRADTIPIEQIKRLRNAGIDVAFIEEMAALGYDRLTVDQLISLGYADVDADDVRRFQEAGFTDLSADDLANLGFADVDADDVEMWANAGYSDLTAEELIQLAHADVDAEFVQAMRGLGLGELSPHELIRLSHADVDASFIAGMRESGFRDLNVDNLIQLGFADVDPAYIRELTDAGIRTMSVEDLIQLGFAGVDVEFITEMADVGLTGLNASDLVMLSHAGVDAEDIVELRDAGFKTTDAKEIIKLHYMDIDPEYVERVRRALNRER